MDELEGALTFHYTKYDNKTAQLLFTGFARVNLEDPSPPGWERLLIDDHPSLLRRVEMARAWATGAAGSRGGS